MSGEVRGQVVWCGLGEGMIQNCILVHLNCCNKMLWNGWLVNRNLYFTALEAGKSKIIFPADLESGENLAHGS